MICESKKLIYLLSKGVFTEYDQYYLGMPEKESINWITTSRFIYRTARN